jgi:hypothetical protein
MKSIKKTVIFIVLFVLCKTAFTAEKTSIFETDTDMIGKKLNFEEGAMVEGLNANPFDSLTNTELDSSVNSAHLYRLKPDFYLEMEEDLLQIGFMPCE